MIVDGADKIFVLLAGKEIKGGLTDKRLICGGQGVVISSVLWLPEILNLHHSMDCGEEALSHLYCEVLVFQEYFDGTAFYTKSI
jgi:hypothetical protein